MGYKYQFITLAGIHNMWYSMFDLSYHYAKGEGMKHYVEMVQNLMQQKKAIAFSTSTRNLVTLSVG